MIRNKNKGVNMFKALLKTVFVLILTVSFAQAAEYGTLKKIKDSGTITIGHRESSVPFAYYNKSQKPIGYSMDLCEKIVQRAEKEIGKKLNRKYYPVNPKTRIQLLANGTIDIECGSTTNNLTRQQQVDYAHVTFITGTKLLVKKSSGIKSIDGMKGKKIALAQGTTNEKAVTKVNADKKLGIQTVNVKDHAEGFLALETGRVDAYSTDHILLFGLISKAKKPSDYAVVGEFLSYDPYAIMIRRDDSAMRLVANAELSDLFRSGEINKIYDKWFMNKLPESGNALGVPQTDLLKAAFTMQALPY